MSRVFGKSVKMLLLTLISIVVVSASAATYYSLLMQPTLTISEAVIRFEQGDDWPIGSSIGANSTYIRLAFRAYPNATLTYDDPFDISNIDGAAHSVRLRHVSITPTSGSASVSNFTYIKFTLNGVSFNYNTTGDNWNTPSDMAYQSLPATTEWAVKVETKATAGAIEALTCTIVIVVDVQV